MGAPAPGQLLRSRELPCDHLAMIRHHVRSFGQHKINAIKLVRELTGLGLKESKDLVDHGGLVRTGLRRSEAEAIARQFLAIDAQVEVLESTSSRSSHTLGQDDYDF
jgi:large subunit ribosomal protein L7/L12